MRIVYTKRIIYIKYITKSIFYRIYYNLYLKTNIPNVIKYNMYYTVGSD